MSIRFQCRRCRRILSYSATQAGMPSRCPGCFCELMVPSSSERIQHPDTSIPIARPAVVPPMSVTAVLPAPPAPPVASISPSVSDSGPRLKLPAAAPPAKTAPRSRLSLALRVGVMLLVVGLVSAHHWSRHDAGLETASSQAAVDGGDTPESLAQLMDGIDRQTATTAMRGSEEFEMPVSAEVALRPGEQAASVEIEASLSSNMRPGATRLATPLTSARSRQVLRTDALHLVRRNDRSEESLRRELANVPEVSLIPADVVALVEGYHASYQMSNGTNFEPGSVLLKQRPDLAELPMLQGSACRINNQAAANLQVLSQKLHGYLDRATPRDVTGLRIDPDLLRQVMCNERRGKRPEWLRPEAIPTLLQLLMFEDRPIRLLLVELLAAIPEKEAGIALAQRAVFDLAPEVRQAALEALKTRPRGEYREVFLSALRYPWVPVADHAAEALVALQDEESVSQLIALLRLPNPSSAWLLSDGRAAVREVVRMQHTKNCMACHPAAVTSIDPVPGAVPDFNFTRITSHVERSQALQRSFGGGSGGGSPSQSSGSPSSSSGGGGGYGGSGGGSTASGGSGSSGGSASSLGSGGSSTSTVQTPTLARAGLSLRVTRSVKLSKMETPLLVRADVTYLRQDFSVQQHLADAALFTAGARFDYLVRTRTFTPRHPEQLRFTTDVPDYGQRTAVLFALRDSTGQDPGATADAWLALYPRAEFDTEVGRLSKALVKASANRKEQLLSRFTLAKGAVYTHALAAAIPQLKGRFQDKVRTALTQRLTRMTAATLRDKLTEEDSEVRRAAAGAIVAKNCKDLVPDLISLLRDDQRTVAQAALAGLKTLTGRDIAPQEFATRDEWLAAAAEWRVWWEDRQTP